MTGAVLLSPGVTLANQDGTFALTGFLTPDTGASLDGSSSHGGANCSANGAWSGSLLKTDFDGTLSCTFSDTTTFAGHLTGSQALGHVELIAGSATDSETLACTGDLEPSDPTSVVVTSAQLVVFCAFTNMAR
jgi:hypothetical protein